jgi:uncharacterized RDD family membrane protein YckC
MTSGRFRTVDGAGPPGHSGPAGLPESGARSPASYGRRLIALIIDGVLCVLVAGLVARPQQWSSLVLIVEYTFFVGLFGETPGMRLLRLRCVRVDTVTGEAVRRDLDRGPDRPVGQPLGPGRALARAVLLSLVLPAVVTDADGRGWHDRAAGSVVINSR